MLAIADFFSCRRVHPDLVRSWQTHTGFNQTRPLEEYDLVVVDTELTGMNPTRDEIVSIGAVRIKNMCIDLTDYFYSLIRPDIPLPKLSTLIHRITPHEVEKAPTLDKVLPRFLDFAGNSLLVGHHMGMDMTFLSRASRQVFGGPFKNPCLDTLRLAQAFQEELFEGYYDQFNLQISYNLADLAKRHTLPRFPMHNALMDAIQTAYLFLFLARKLKGGKIKTLEDLHTAGKTRRFL